MDKTELQSSCNHPRAETYLETQEERVEERGKIVVIRVQHFQCPQCLKLFGHEVRR